MKKLLLAMAVCVSIVGCGKSEGEKAKDKIDNEGKDVQVLVNQGLEEYKASYDTTYVSSMNLAELQQKRAQLTSARAKFAAAQVKVQKALDIQAKNKDSVKFEDKEAVIKLRSTLGDLISDIDSRIQTIERTMKRKYGADAAA